MRKFWTKPVVVEAQQWSPSTDIVGAAEIALCLRLGIAFMIHSDKSLTLHTPDGNLRVNLGDWIIKSGKQFSACKPELFALSYEAVR